jgi:hypothetical protein
MTRLRPGADVVSSRLGDEVVLVDLRTDDILVLNGTGARIWELLADGHDPGAAREILLAEFDVGEAELAREVERFVDQLRARELLVAAPAPASGSAP